MKKKNFLSQINEADRGLTTDATTGKIDQFINEFECDKQGKCSTVFKILFIEQFQFTTHIARSIFLSNKVGAA